MTADELVVALLDRIAVHGPDCPVYFWEDFGYSEEARGYRNLQVRKVAINDMPNSRSPDPEGEEISDAPVVIILGRGR